MPLSSEQRERLQKALGPIIQEAVEGISAEAAKEAVAAHLKEFKDERTDYTRKIFSNREMAEIDDMKDGGRAIARIARCVALGKGDPEKAVAIARRDYTDSMGDIVVKALSSGAADEGGVFVPSNLSATFVDALRAESVVRLAGPVVVDLDGGNLKVPKITADPTAEWVGEGKKRRTSNAKTGSLNFVARTLQGKSSLTQKLLSRSAQNSEMIIRDGLIEVMANAEDQAFLAGSGSENVPRGMLDWAAAANRFDATQAGAAATLTEVQADLNTAMGNLADNNVSMNRATWFQTWRSRNFLAFALRDTEDTPVFKGELTAASPTLNGQPAFRTNNIPNNLGGGNNESRTYLAAMDKAWLAEESGLTIRASTEASFEDETGTTISAFDHGLLVIIIERDLDFVMAHDVATTVIEAVKWGA